MRKSVLSIFSFVLIAGSSFGQITDMGGPIGWKRKMNLGKSVPTHVMPGFDLQAIQEQDRINDAAKDAPWRFGYKYDTEIDFNDGVWIDLPNENRLWRTDIVCEGAMTINLLFEDFYMPEGAFLYLYDADKTNRVGAYTSRNNRPDGLLGTELVHGEHIIVEYYEPKSARGLGHFTIEDVVHGYRSLDAVQQSLEKALNSSGDCNIDVECPLGNGWDDQIRSVAMIVVGGSGICTGALINNTCEDGRPLFLTANHCLGGSTGNWAFRFNWKSPAGTESCATTAGSTDPGPPYDQSANGATVLVSGNQADHALLEIDNMTVSDAQSWNAFYAGWNNDDTDGSITQATGIHHPSGDVMKICRENNTPYHSTNGAAAVWWIDEWEEGVTEPGSSGSPLFDQNHRIIGQLYGGAAACSGTSNNGDYDYYGRLGVSWGLGIGDHLAPASCGSATTNDGWDPNGPSLPDDASIQAIDRPVGLICNDSIFPVVILRNAGGNNLTSVTINWDVDGAGTQTMNWTGTIAPNGTETLFLPAMSGTAGAHTFNAYTSNPNGVADTDPSNDAVASTYTLDDTGVLTTVTIMTDCYGYENSWEIYDASSTLVAEGGNLAVPPGGLQTAAQSDAGALGNAMTIDERLCLAVGCYDFVMYDDWGDGMEGSAQWGCNTDGDYEITNGSGTVLGSMQNVDFGNSETINFCVVDDASIEEYDWLNFQLYPNPSNGTFEITLANASNANYDIQVRDITGRIVYSSSINGNTHTVELNEVGSGSYFIQLSGSNVTLNKKVIVQ